jgi:flagellin
MADVNLSKAVRSNLLSLQSTAANMAKTQNRLATGLKVNSALDNPSNFFTASSLNSRAGDMANLLDSMSSGIKTIEAADNGLKSITKTVESMQSTLRQARQDKSFKTGSYSIDATAVTAASIDTNAEAAKISISGGSVGSTAVNVDLTTAKGKVEGTAYTALDFAEATDAVSFKLSDDGNTTTTSVAVTKGTGANTLKVTVGSTITDNIAVTSGAAVTGAELASAINTGFDAAGAGNGFEASFAGGKLAFTSNTADDASTAATTMTNFAFVNAGAGTAITAAAFGFTAGGAGVSAGGTASITGVAAKTVDALVTAIGNTASLDGKVRASNDNGKLRIENLSTEDLSVVGVSGADGELDGTTGASNTATIGGNDVRKNLVKQFNELRDQLDKFADDASFNGINLLRGDKLKLTFNETGTSTIEIQAKDEDGVASAVNTNTLAIDSAVNADFDSDASLDVKLDGLSSALDSLRSQSSTFGSNLSVVENRQDFTKNMINTLETGAANLTLADTNEEAANLLALQTRQQLSSTALSMASQADQAVLRLF